MALRITGKDGLSGQRRNRKQCLRASCVCDRQDTPVTGADPIRWCVGDRPEVSPASLSLPRFGVADGRRMPVALARWRWQSALRPIGICDSRIATVRAGPAMYSAFHGNGRAIRRGRPWDPHACWFRRAGRGWRFPVGCRVSGRAKCRAPATGGCFGGARFFAALCHPVCLGVPQ